MRDWSAYVRSRLSLPALAKEREAEIVEDLAAQLEEAYRDALRTGATEDEAIARAEQHIGDWQDLNRRLDRSKRDRQPAVERWNERADDRAMNRASGWSFVATVRQDLLHAWRVMRQSRSLIAIGVVSLALGIGANTAIFSVINGLLLRRLPVAHANALVSLTSPDMSGIMSGVQTGERGLLSYHEFENLRDRHDTFDGLLAFSSDVFVAPIATEANGEGASHAITLVSGTYFPTLGLAASKGRVFGTEVDAAPMANPIAVVSDDFWRRRMQADPHAIGRTIYIRRTAFTVVGVLPAAFTGLVVGEKPDVYVPLTMQQAVFPGMDLLAQTPGKATRIMFLHVVGRLRPDVTIQQATASANAAFAQGLQAEGSSIADETRRKELLDAQLVLRFVPHGLSPLRSEYTTPLLVLMGLVGLVLLLACSNVASLLLARATGRRRELALRVALGANRARLIRQLLTESLFLATLGAAAGILVSRLGVTALLRLVSEDSSPVPLDAPVDATVLAFAAGLTVVTSLLFGLIPAIRATRLDLNDVLRGASSRLSGSGRGAGRWPIAKGIAAVQVALSLVLVVTAGLLVRSLQNLTAVPVGYETRHLVTFEINPSEAGYAPPAMAALYEDLTAKLTAVPGVKAVSLSSNGLFRGGDSGDEVAFPGETYPAGTDMGARFDAIGPNYFSTIGIPIIRGRDVESQDSVGMRSCWLGQRMQKQFFPDKEPVGRPMIIHYSFGDVPCEIRGVVADARVNSQRGEQDMRFYTAYFGAASKPRAAVFALRVEDRIDAVAANVRQVVRGAGAFTPPALHTVQELIEWRQTSDRLTARLGAFFGVVALLLAAIGLYGLLSYSVGRRVGEIGLRMALGAGQGRILRLIVGEALIVTVVGAIVGLTASLSSTRVLRTMLFNLSPRDPLTFVFGPVILLAVGIAAAALPAWRASRTDPLVALRTE